MERKKSLHVFETISQVLFRAGVLNLMPLHTISQLLTWKMHLCSCQLLSQRDILLLQGRSEASVGRQPPIGARLGERRYLVQRFHAAVL